LRQAVACTNSDRQREERYRSKFRHVASRLAS
jgi:hypothetical protein